MGWSGGGKGGGGIVEVGGGVGGVCGTGSEEVKEAAWDQRLIT